MNVGGAGCIGLVWAVLAPAAVWGTIRMWEKYGPGGAAIYVVFAFWLGQSLTSWMKRMGKGQLAGGPRAAAAPALPLPPRMPAADSTAANTPPDIRGGQSMSGNAGTTLWLSAAFYMVGAVGGWFALHTLGLTLPGFGLHFLGVVFALAGVSLAYLTLDVGGQRRLGRLVVRLGMLVLWGGYLAFAGLGALQAPIGDAGHRLLWHTFLCLVGHIQQFEWPWFSGQRPPP